MSDFTIAPVNASVQCIQTNYTGQYTVCITDNQVYSSQDYGQTFSHVNGLPAIAGNYGRNTLISCDTSGQYFVIAQTNGGGIWYSSDSGVSFTKVSNQLLYSITANSDFNQLTGVKGSNVYISTDHGTTWNLVYSSGDYYYLNGTSNHLIATGNSKISISDDSGHTWTDLSGFPNSTGNMYYVSACRSDDGTKIYAVAEGTQSTTNIAVSYDSGLTWTHSSYVSGYSYTISCSLDGSVVSVSSAFPDSQGIYYSLNAGLTWRSKWSVNANIDNWGITSVSGNGVYITSGNFHDANVYTFKTVGPWVSIVLEFLIVPGDAISLPVESTNGPVDWSVNWGDNHDTSGTWITLGDELIHAYDTLGTYTVTLTVNNGYFDIFGLPLFNPMFDTWLGVDKLTSVNYWSSDYTSFRGAFINSLILISVPALRYNVKNIEGMFALCNFNQNLNSWQTGNVTNMYAVFGLNQNFNGQLQWDTLKVTDMSFMFDGTTSFNQRLQWNTYNVTNMAFMFQDASSFNQDIGRWNIGSIDTSGMFGMLDNCGIDIINYNATLNGWAYGGNTPYNVTLDASGLFYDGSGYAAHLLLTTPDVPDLRKRGKYKLDPGYGWTINGDTYSGPPICYAKGTKILTSSGYILIEDLKVGDLVTTYLHGDIPIEIIKWNKFINNPEKWAECMYRLPSTNPEYDDLIVTGGHGILKQNIKTEDLKNDYAWFRGNKRYSKIDGMYLQRAAFSKEFVKITDNEVYTYYHIVLQSADEVRYGIWANGILSESTFKKDISKI